MTRPVGGDDWELRSPIWGERAMFNWLCAKANPWTGRVRTSWPVLAEQTGLSADHVRKLCARLKAKRYVSYPGHRGQRRRPIEVAIARFPIRFGRGLSDVVSEVRRKTFEESRSSAPVKKEREKERNRSLSLRSEQPGEIRLW